MSDQYPANSRASAQPPPARQRQTAVVTNVKVRKKPIGTRLAERGSGIWRDVKLEVILPYLRDLFADAFHRGVDQTFYWDSPGQSHYRGNRGGGRPGQQQVSSAGYVITDYNSQYTAGAAATSVPERGTRPFDFSIYTFPDYASGRELIDRLLHLIHGYGHATVNDLYDLMNMAGDHVGENYGWDSLEALAGAEVRRVRGGGGHYLDIPDARPLKK